MLTIACCLVMVMVIFSVWLVGGYANVFLPLSVVIVTLSLKDHWDVSCRSVVQDYSAGP